jgi:N-acetylneuraminate synthase
VDIAARSGADIVKFQTFQAAELVSKGAQKARYQLETTDATESQFEMIRKLQLSEADHQQLLGRCRERGIVFLSSPFDIRSLHFLSRGLGLRTIKVPSGEIVNGPLLLEIAREAESVIMSTGMATLAEIEQALGVLAFGFTRSEDEPPGRRSFIQAYSSEDGQRAIRERVTLLHCTTEYPAPLEEVNLRAIDTLRTAFDCRVGYSDHTAGICVSIAAVARGASVIEKHFTSSRSLPGPDHRASLEPDELAELVSAIRSIEKALGDGVKRPTPSETRNAAVARKVLVAAVPINEGDIFSPGNIAAKRATDGVEASAYWDLMGRRALRKYAIDEPLRLE